MPHEWLGGLCVRMQHLDERSEWAGEWLGTIDHQGSVSERTGYHRSAIVREMSKMTYSTIWASIRLTACRLDI